MHELLEESRPTVGIKGLIEHVNDYVRKFGSAESSIPFWTGTMESYKSPDETDTPSIREEFVSIRLVSNQTLSLVHSEFHSPGPADLVTTLSNGSPIRVPIEIHSCEKFRSNWHRTAATFRRANLGMLRWKSAESIRLIRDARQLHRDDRKSARSTYHCPAVLAPLDQPQTAYVRDISEKGMGFLHAKPIEAGPVAVDVYPGHKDEPIRIHVQITWCERSIDVGFRSGGFYIDMTD